MAPRKRAGLLLGLELGVPMLARLLLLASLCLAPSVTLASQPAHGDFPRSTGVVFHQPEDTIPIVITNYGYLFYEGEAAFEGGSNWSWVCEEIFPKEAVPEGFQATPDGLFVGSYYGLYRSEDGCTWEGPDLPGIAGLYITQILPEPGDPGRLYVSTSTNGADNGLFLSTDGGRSFDLFHGFGANTTLRGFMMGEGGSPIYVIGWEQGAPRLWISPDGAQWRTFETQETSGGSVFPLGLDRGDASVGYIKVVLPEERGERLVRVNLEGEFEALLEIDSLSAFGAQGDSLEAGGRGSGFLRSRDGGLTWTDPVDIPEIGCLTYQNDERYQCANNFSDGASVFLGDPFEGEAEPLMDFGEVRGVKACPGESVVATTCQSYWENVKVLMGFDDPTPTAIPTPTSSPTSDGEPGCAGCEGQGALLLLFPLLPWLRRRP